MMTSVDEATSAQEPAPVAPASTNSSIGSGKMSKNRYIVSRVDQVFCHGFTHDSEADEADFLCHVASPIEVGVGICRPVNSLWAIH